MQLAAKHPLVEIRLDLMKLDIRKIELLAMQCRRWVVTCRPGSYTEDERTVQLSAAIHAGATYVDVEYDAEPGYRQALIDLAKRRNCSVIISYHHMELTPDVEIMEKIIQYAQAMGADIVKIAVTANSPADCARVMSLYEHHQSLIAFAMGEAGKITRVAAPLLGADFTYASIDETCFTAPGQLTASQLEVIYRLFIDN
jgi:3-dehydroquinate dehydratase type I